MKTSIFFNDMLTKGAIVGCVMLVFGIAQAAATYYGGLSGFTISGLLSIVWFVLYCYLMYRFTRGYANIVLTERKDLPYFTYGNGLSYIIMVSMLAGIISALGNYLFLHHVIGYENYIDSYVKSLQDILMQAQIPASMADTYNTMFSTIKSQPEPSLFSSLLSGVSSNLILGTIVGLVVAAFTKREAQIFDNDNNKSGDEQ